MMQIVKSFPELERFMLRSQITRAARSVTNNIAEGFGRYTYKDNIKFLVNSRGSLTELIDHLIIAVDEGYVEETRYKAVKEKILRCLMIINGMIRYLRNAKPDEIEANEPYIPYNSEYLLVPE